MFKIDVQFSRGTRQFAMQLDAGQGVTALVGPSGAGKTSLLRVLAGLEASRGTIELADRQLAGNGHRSPRIVGIWAWCFKSRGCWTISRLKKISA